MRLQKTDLIKYATYMKTDYTNGKYSIRIRENSIGDNVLELRDNEKETSEIIFSGKTRDAYEFLRGFYRGYRFLNPNQSEKLENLETIYEMIAELRDYVEETDYIEKEYILEKLQDMQQYAK